jgi:predicted transcriptional regulator
MTVKKNESDLPLCDVSPVDMLKLLKTLFEEDEKFKILDLLAKREAANMREIGRCTGLSHGKITRSVDSLIKKGVVDFYCIGLGLNAYRLSPNLGRFKKFYRQNP